MSAAPSPDRHIDAARRRLAHLGGVAARTSDTERRILAAAEERLGVVDKTLASLRPRTLTDPAAGDRYRDLTTERGQLVTVIASAREALGQ